MDDILFEKIAYEMQAEAIKELKRCAEILNESCDPNRQDLGMYMMRIIGHCSFIEENMKEMDKKIEKIMELFKQATQKKLAKRR